MTQFEVSMVAGFFAVIGMAVGSLITFFVQTGVVEIVVHKSS